MNNIREEITSKFDKKFSKIHLVHRPDSIPNFQRVVVVSLEEFLDFLSNMSSDGWKNTLQKGKNING